MDPTQPFLEISGPDGQHLVVQLTKARTTIGRYPPPFNDVALQPDPQRYVTREMHCFLEHQGPNWYVVSHGKNATLIDQGEDLCLVRGKLLLADHDRIYIRGGRSETGEPQFWKLLFRDPEGTQSTHSAPYLEYEERSGTLFKVAGGVRNQISLRLLEDKLIRYMFACNRENDDTPTLIPAEDLMQAVWEEDARHYDLQALHKLIASLREKVEPDPQAPKFLINQRKRGYLLNTHLLPSVESDIAGEK